MSSVRWEWQDSGSSPGHLQAVADDGTFSAVQAAYRALLDHGVSCRACREPEKRCEVADGLYRAWRDAGGPWAQ